MRQQPWRVQKLRDNARLFLDRARQHGLNTGTSNNSPVIPVIIGKALPCIELYRRLYARGILALPIIYPAVPENASRLRFFISSMHTEAQINDTIGAIADILPSLPL